MTSFDITCFGAAHVDLIAKAEVDLVAKSSTPGRIERSVGGVAANVARQLARQNLSVAMVSQTGDDPDGDYVAKTLNTAGVDTSLMMKSSSEGTGSYLAIEGPDGEMFLAVSDTHALLATKPDDLSKAGQNSLSSSFWFLDTNLTPPMLNALTEIEGRPKLAIDAVSVTKAVRLAKHLTDYAIVFCNKDEAEALFEEQFTTPCDAGRAMANKGVEKSVITDGPNPLCVQSGTDILSLGIPPVQVTSVTGAGDTLIAGTLAGLIRGETLQASARHGIQAAAQQLTGGHAAKG